MENPDTNKWDEDTKHLRTAFKEGTLPIKYLVVPLISTRLTARDCRPLIENEKITNNQQGLILD